MIAETNTGAICWEYVEGRTTSIDSDGTVHRSCQFLMTTTPGRTKDEVLVEFVQMTGLDRGAPWMCYDGTKDNSCLVVDHDAKKSEETYFVREKQYWRITVFYQGS